MATSSINTTQLCCYNRDRIFVSRKDAEGGNTLLDYKGKKQFTVGLVKVLIKEQRTISCEEEHVMCEKGDLWVEGIKPVSQEAASLLVC